MEREAENRTITFAEFELDASRRRLTRRGETVPLNARAFDVLVFLAENAGRLIAKNEILSAVWQEQFVEEANLAVQISALRKALGERRGAPRILVTIPGKGYKFIADVETSGETAADEERSPRIPVEQDEFVDEKNLAISRPSLSRRSFLPAIVAAGVLTIISAIIWFYFERKQDDHGLFGTTNEMLSKHTFPTLGGTPLDAGISRDGKNLAYIVSLKGQTSIRIGDIESGNSIQLTPYADRLYGCIEYSPDAKNLYFTIRDSNHPATTLMRMSVLGGAQQELIRGVDSGITFSPDGKYLAFIRRQPERNGSSIVIADAETGKDERILVDRKSEADISGEGIAWSPDGKVIAFAAAGAEGGDTDILAANVDDGAVRQIAGGIEKRIANLAWLTDQSGLVLNRNSTNSAGDGQIWYVSYPDGTLQNISNDTLNYNIFSLSDSVDGKIAAVTSRTEPEIWIAPNADLTRARRLLAGSWIRHEGGSGLSIAPDGKILFTARSGGGRAIWEMDGEGQNQRQLTSTEKGSSDEQIGVTADDRFIVFQSDRSGTTQIWRANRDGTDLRQLTQDVGSAEPTLTPDGNFIVYSRDISGTETLWRMRVDGGDPRQLTTDEASWPSVSPDGRYIACAYGKSIDSVYSQVAMISVEGGKPIRVFQVPPRAALYNRLKWSPDGKSILYKDEIQGLWKQDIDSDKPKALVGMDDFRVNYLTPAGADLIYTGGVIKREIVLIDR